MKVRLRPPRFKRAIMIALTLALFLAGLCGLVPVLSAAAQEKEVIRLYFPQPDRLALGAEERSLDRSESLSGRARNIVLALLSGPKTRLVPAFPSGSRLRQVFVDQAGVAYVDFEAPPAGSGMGALQERLAVWSLVNSLCLNLEEIKTVKVLAGGGEVPVLFGHVDLSRPLLPDESLIE